MSTSTKLGDEFLRIPKLDLSGKNWVIFKDWFTWALDTQCMMDHIDSTRREPADPISEADRAKVTEEKPLTDKKREIRERMEEGSEGMEARRSYYEATDHELHS